MKNNISEKPRSLGYWRELYERAVESQAEYADALERNMRQYVGDDGIDGSGERATTVRNITYEIIESEVDADVPVPKADPAAYDPHRDRNARAIERLCAAVKSELPFEAMNDADERYTYVYGGSVWYIEWDASRGGRGGVRIHCLSPLDFIPQPGIYDVEGMEYCFLRFTTTKSELKRKYGVSDSELSLAECEYSYGDGSDDDAVTLIVAFYKSEGEVGRLIFSGDLLLSDIPAYYVRKLYVCEVCGETSELCSCGHGRLVPADVKYETVLFGESGERITLPYYTPKSFPIVIRRNTPATPALLGLSDCERIRPQQQAINKVESRILQKLLRSGVTPVMPEDASVSVSNAVFGQVIKLRPGESADSYGTIDTTPDISQDIAEADRLYDQAKRVLGISDALQGTDDPVAESGYARQLKISRAEGRLETKRRMKYHCYSELYRKIFEHYLAFADEPRSFSYKDELGQIRTSEFNRFDFIESDGEGGYRYADEYLFSVDLNGGSEYSREALWERNLSNLERGTLGDKESPVTLLRYWQSQERAHYPFARENVEYFKSMVERDVAKTKENCEETKNES